MPSVEIPYKPRAIQRTIHDGLHTHRFGAVVAHRRMGKTVLSINELIRRALVCPNLRPRCGYVAPTYSQGKAIAFDMIQHYARSIPGTTFNQSELRADFVNGGQVRIFGADSPDSLRGLYFDYVCLDEVGMMPAKIFSEVIRPALSDRKGGAFFIGTPAGKNMFYEVIERAKTDPEWFCGIYPASLTGIVDANELAAAKRDMTEDEYAQEYECSFAAAVKGAIYAKELEQARSAGRVCRIPVEPVLPVDTHWDLGVGDSTAIWFSQSLRNGEVRLVDYYEASGEGLPHYAQVLRMKGYTYGTHWAPHDIQVRELASGRSRLEAARQLGIDFRVCPNIAIEDGIHAARMLMPLCWFDAERCKAGLEALQHYRRDYNVRLNEFKATPVHDWAEHGASAFRYLAVSHETSPEKDLSARWNMAMPSSHWAAT